MGPSIGISLEVDETTLFDKLVDLVRKMIQRTSFDDYLIRLVTQSGQFPDKLYFPRPMVFYLKDYRGRKFLKRLYLKYWTKNGNRGCRDEGWCGFCISAILTIIMATGLLNQRQAICKIKGLEYKQLEGVSYFPYDLVVEGGEYIGMHLIYDPRKKMSWN